MRQAWIALGLACFAASAQNSSSSWKTTLTGLADRPAPNTSIQDIDRFTENVQLAAPYFATLTPGDYESNREFVRRMWAYLTALDRMARDPRMRLAVGRARRAMGELRIGIPAMPADLSAGEPPPSADQAVTEPPFAKALPDENVPESEKRVADEVRSRYESDLARATAAWQNIEDLRRRLAARGLALASQTAASVARLQLDFEMAVKGLREHDWAEVRTDLERAEYETGKVFRAVGQ
jgi:hypothetical protein